MKKAVYLFMVFALMVSSVALFAYSTGNSDQSAIDMEDNEETSQYPIETGDSEDNVQPPVETGDSGNGDHNPTDTDAADNDAQESTATDAADSDVLEPSDTDATENSDEIADDTEYYVDDSNSGSTTGWNGTQAPQDLDGMDVANGSQQYLELVEHWAPTVYQDINKNRDSGRSDIPTTLNYDGDWDPSNNWDNLNNYSLIPSVYYSVRETATHYFIEYDFYYPQDRGLYYLDEHENDLEGCLLAIRKVSGNNYGKLEILETQAHDNWYQYVESGLGISKGAETIDGAGINKDGHRPKIYVSANSGPVNLYALFSMDSGHAVWAWGHKYGSNSANGGDGILLRYVSGSVKTVVQPTNFNGNFTQVYDYNLVSMDELWFRQLASSHISSKTYSSWGYLRGNNGKGNNVCTMPWVKNDRDDDTGAYEGVYWSDPAFFIDVHFNNLGSFSHDYVFNPYWTHEFAIESVTSLVYKDPANIFNGNHKHSDVFFAVLQSSHKFIREEHWKTEDLPNNTPVNVYWGERNSKSGYSFSTNCNKIRVATKPGDKAYIRVWDSDGTSGDDHMGDYVLSFSNWGQSISNVSAKTSSGEAIVRWSARTNACPGAAAYSEWLGNQGYSQPPSEWSREGELSVFEEEDLDEDEHPDVLID
jgi:hypothetical protein